MARWKGTVVNKKENGMVDVIIGPSQQSIPNAPESINERVCHCSSESSNVIVPAINMARADIGDFVNISRKTTIIIKNLVFLMGLPLLGGGVGLFIYLLNSNEFYAGYGILSVLLGLVFGTGLGYWIYRKNSFDEPFILDEIISKAPEGAKIEPCKPASPVCESCAFAEKASRMSC